MMILFKATALSITSAVTKLFNISITLGEISSEWKTAHVSPIPKGTTSRILQIIDQYHYFLCWVSFLRLIWEAFYFTFYKSTIPFLTTSGALPKASQLLVYSLLLQTNGTNGLMLALRYVLDYSEAFDTISHWLLLAKLQSVSIHPYILRWIASYLCGKTQYACVGGAASQSQPVMSGVPQGSMLGLLLSNFYINTW